MSNASIVMKSVSKCYGDSHGEDSAETWAVRNVSFSVFPGEVTVLMGPSGSGKTTLLSMIGCVLAPTGGRLNVCGVDLESCNEAERQRFRRYNVGFIFQSYNLLSSLTARENIEVALTLRGADPSQAGDLLAGVGMEDKAETYPLQLSGGQRQRVAITRALAGDPPVLLADEPTAALDAFQGRRVMDLLRARAHNEGTTVLVVTHDPRVREFADRVVDMEDGRIKRIVRLLRESAPAATALGVLAT